ncbi:MAG: FHA domain-containing protein [Actinomycetota bacterium]
MHDLLVTWPGGKARFSPGDSPIAVGRSADAAVVLTDPAISRRHLEIVWLGSSWIANDSSTHGSFDPIGVRLAPTWTVGKLVTVRLGGVGGTEVKLEVVEHRPELAGVVLDPEPTPAEVQSAPEVASAPEVPAPPAIAPAPTPPAEAAPPAPEADVAPPAAAPSTGDDGAEPGAGPSGPTPAPPSTPIPLGGPEAPPAPPAPAVPAPSGSLLEPAPPSALPPSPIPDQPRPESTPALAQGGAIESIAIADAKLLIDDVDPDQISEHLTQQVAAVGEDGLPVQAALPAVEPPPALPPPAMPAELADASPLAVDLDGVEAPAEAVENGVAERDPAPPPPPPVVPPSILDTPPTEAPVGENGVGHDTNGSAPRPSILGPSDDDHPSADGPDAPDSAIGGIEAPETPPMPLGNGATPPSILDAPDAIDDGPEPSALVEWDLPQALPSAQPVDSFADGPSSFDREPAEPATPPSPDQPPAPPVPEREFELPAVESPFDEIAGEELLPPPADIEPAPNGDRPVPPMPDDVRPASAPPSILDQVDGAPPMPPMPAAPPGPAGAMPPMPPGNPAVGQPPIPIPIPVPAPEAEIEPPVEGFDEAFDDGPPPSPAPFLGPDDEVSTTELDGSPNNAAPAANEPGSWDDFMASHDGGDDLFTDGGFGLPGASPDDAGIPVDAAPVGAAPLDGAPIGETETRRPPAADTIITNDTIQIAVDGESYVFIPDIDVTVGRDPSCVVNLDERHSLVSRHHLKISHHDGNWWIEDHSSKGTFIDGRKISKPYKAEGAFLAHLGDDDAGTSMRIITAGEHRAPRSFNTLLFALFTIMVLTAVGFLAYLLIGSRGDDTEATAAGDGAGATQAATTLPGADLALAKQATVLLLSETGFGSGFFVTDTLIVTNQHVAVLDETLAVAVSRTADEPAQVEFAAQTVALHPYLDIAVMEITSDLDGNPVSTSGLRPVPIGDSGALTLGDEVFNTGFPADLSPAGFDDMGDLLLPAVSTTSGEAANFSIWPGCSNPARNDFIPIDSPAGVGCSPDGDVTRAVVITTFSSGEGASGSPVFANNSVVAVVFSGPEGNENAGRNITTAAFAEWLDDVIAENG